MPLMVRFYFIFICFSIGISKYIFLRSQIKPSKLLLRIIEHAPLKEAIFKVKCQHRQTNSGGVSKY